MDVSIIVQTCDKYEKFWNGFFYYMDKFWDKKIDVPIYFCNEIKVPKTNFVHLPTGSGSFVDNLKFILKNIKTKYVFYLLEDFWPIDTINYDLFSKFYSFVVENNAKCLQISNYTPCYSLEKTNFKINNQNVLKFNRNSDWRFNFQSRFWDKNFLINCLEDPKISESLVSSAITVEVESNKKLDKNIEVYFYHYFWYPMSGVSYRGNFTSFGEDLQNNMMVDLYGKGISEEFHGHDQSSSSSSSS